MRGLFSSELFWPHIGGAEIFATKLLPALQTRGHELMVVTRQDSETLLAEDSYQGIPVLRFPFWSAIAGRNVERVAEIRQQLVKLKKSYRPDLVHIHGMGAHVLFHQETTASRPTPLLVTLTNVFEGQVGAAGIVSRVLRLSSWLTCKAGAVLDQARQLVPEIIGRSSVIHNGLELSPLLPEPLPNKAPRILCLGRLAPQKGFDLALTAFASISKRFPHIRLVIAGDGPGRKSLEQQAARLGLVSAIDFLGWVTPDRVPALINTASMVVMPSRWEGLPSVALQAASMARPLVATRVGGLPEIVEHQRTGLLVEPEDPGSLAKAMTFLLEHPETAGKLGAAGRSRVREVFSWGSCVDAYDALYRQLAGTNIHA